MRSWVINHEVTHDANGHKVHHWYVDNMDEELLDRRGRGYRTREDARLAKRLLEKRDEYKIGE